jgi:hypothetical protein
MWPTNPTKSTMTTLVTRSAKPLPARRRLPAPSRRRLLRRREAGASLQRIVLSAAARRMVAYASHLAAAEGAAEVEARHLFAALTQPAVRNAALTVLRELLPSGGIVPANPTRPRGRRRVPAQSASVRSILSAAEDWSAVTGVTSASTVHVLAAMLDRADAATSELRAAGVTADGLLVAAARLRQPVPADDDPFGAPQATPAAAIGFLRERPEAFPARRPFGIPEPDGRVGRLAMAGFINGRYLDTPLGRSRSRAWVGAGAVFIGANVAVVAGAVWAVTNDLMRWPALVAAMVVVFCTPLEIMPGAAWAATRVAAMAWLSWPVSVLIGVSAAAELIMVGRQLRIQRVELRDPGHGLRQQRRRSGRI